MSKKTVIIIILLAVAGFIAWKKGLFSKSVVIDTSGVSGDVDNSDINAVVAKTSMTATEKDYCAKLAEGIGIAAKRGDQGWSMRALKESAVKNGVTYAQQLVLSALWVMYNNKGIIGADYCSEIANEVKKM